MSTDTNGAVVGRNFQNEVGLASLAAEYIYIRFFTGVAQVLKIFEKMAGIKILRNMCKEPVFAYTYKEQIRR